MAPAGGGNIKVVVRVRPFNSREIDRNAKCVVSMQDVQTILTPAPQDAKAKGSKATLDQPKTFAYDKSYWSFNKSDSHFAGQENVFDDLGSPLLDNAFEGYNNCIFAYGQTGSGKSYSMMGYGPEPGIIPRICKGMFDRIEELQSGGSTMCRVEVSYMEIYNERVRDLLNPANKGNLRVREHPSTGPYVEDLAKLVVRSFPEIENLMDEGNKARTVAATNMNETSSRSHAVFTLTLTQKKHDSDTNMDMERVAKISLVDLAGSERATSTGATGARLKEGAEINRSLSTLGRVIAALADLSVGKKKNLSMVPYRDSVLTWLLKDSLGGNSMTAMIATISPADINFEETLSTLRYADSTKRIKQHAVVNEDANARMIRELKEELAQLRSKLAGGISGGTPGVAGEIGYPEGTPLEKQLVTITGADGSSRQVSKADIAEQLNQSEKLYQDLNQTWEQKLQKTEEIHKEREAALEELGISIEKGFVGMSTPKKMPHLVNLSDDPLLAECLVYNLKPGRTIVGNDEMTTSAEIRLKGSKILQEHCTFENKDGIVTVTPNDDAAVMVNGRRTDKEKRLRSGYRIILGDFHIFRFNHPEEARAEREEQGSKLKQSITADELESPTDEHRHSRSSSRSESDIDRERLGSESPTYGMHDNDYDWSFARREAASAILGSDKKVSHLTDEELDVLFEDLQRVRANRRGRESTLFSGETDTDSNASNFLREKYLSSTTLDNMSLDTALTTPSTPPHRDDVDRRKSAADIPLPDGDDEDLEELSDEAKAEQQVMQENLEELKQRMEREMQQQKEEYEQKILELQTSTPQRPSSLVQDPGLSVQQKGLARWAIEKWRQRKYVRMAGLLLQYASILKEAQILSQAMGQPVVFQFTIIDVGHAIGSSYDLVMFGVSEEDDDDELHATIKPCLGIRVIDFAHHAIYLWSIGKLEKRVQVMRKMQQYLDRPEYLQHFRLEDPFVESSVPQFSRVGEAQVSLAAVFESRVADFTVDVISPYSYNLVGILKLSLEPSLADAPLGTFKFNVILHEMTGFQEMEGTDVHAQLYVPRITEEGGATTTQLLNDFNEGPVRFESLHGMSLPISSSRDSVLRISIFAKVTDVHLDKLLSWDDMRDSARDNHESRNGSRLAETEFNIGERHDVFAQVQILELTENGQYDPVEALQANTMDIGAFQLHQGLQRRICIRMTSSCGDLIPWRDISSIRAGQVRLVDANGHTPEIVGPQPEVNLKLISAPSVVENADGTTNVKIVGQWDSSAHDSVLLDRTTSDKYRVQLTLYWDVASPKLLQSLEFALEIGVQVRARSFLRATSMFTSLWNANRVAHSTSGVFAIKTRPNIVQSTMDLWRMDTKHDYVKGEELLENWTPRTVSLVRDYVDFRKKQARAAEIEIAKSVFGRQGLAIDGDDLERTTSQLSTEQKELLERVLALWTSSALDPSMTILRQANVEPPKKGAAFAAKKLVANEPEPESRAKAKAKAKIAATVQFQSKNPSLSKAGSLLMPDATQTRWVRRFLELRRPYIHIYSADGDELNAVNLADSRVDHQPHVALLLQRPNGSALHIFAVYARQNSFLFASKSEREKLEWILRIDQAYFGNGSGSEDGRAGH